MTTFRFVTNLRPGSVSAFEKSGHTPTAWLLSSHRLTTATEALAHAERDAGAELFADNGTKPLIDLVRRRFGEPLRPLRLEIQSLRRNLGEGRRMPDPGEVPATLSQRAAIAAREVENAVEAELDAESVETVTARQLRMHPTSLIVKEDFTAACLVGLHLEREITGWPVLFFERLCERSLEWSRVAKALPSTRDVTLFVTLPAMDYSTARASARLAAEANVDSVAIGFAGINLDSSFIDVARLPHRHRLSGSAPRRYVRTTEIVLGVRDGYREAGARLRRFHALGLGATALYPVLGAGLDWYTHVTVDATSPIHDAVNDLVYYDHEAHGDRVDVTELASRIVAGGRWPFECPFCSYLRGRFDVDVDGARRWWQSAGEPEIERDMLHPDEPLGQLLEAVASARDGSTPVQARGRIGHNHWACEQLAAEFPSSKRAEMSRQVLRDLSVVRSFTIRFGVLAALEILAAVDKADE